MECRVFPFSRLTTESFLHFKRMKKHWDMQKHQDQRKICINANLSTRSSAFEAGDCCVGLWPPWTIRGHWVGGDCCREGPQRSGCSLILGQVSSLISNRTQGKFLSDPGLLIVYPSSATNLAFLKLERCDGMKVLCHFVKIILMVLLLIVLSELRLMLFPLMCFCGCFLEKFAWLPKRLHN